MCHPCIDRRADKVVFFGEAHTWGEVHPFSGFAGACVKQVHESIRHLLILMTILERPKTFPSREDRFTAGASLHQTLESCCKQLAPDTHTTLHMSTSHHPAWDSKDLSSHIFSLRESWDAEKTGNGPCMHLLAN